MKRCKRILSMLVIAPLLLAAPDLVIAQSAAEKLGRGAAAIGLGVLEIPGNIVKETKAHGALGVATGLATGLGMCVTRELVGVYEVISSPFPVPSGFQPILKPEYPWDYFK